MASPGKHMGISFLEKVFALSLFACEKLSFWRVRSGALFIRKVTQDHSLGARPCVGHKLRNI
ncbi:hypothetical protein BBH88_07205 [Planococcus antarcticus DSM 14505]|uniref:Uncharacterized protein n=1 Tax=Planococcus antarcticus DSM 14505 TaxID=1185653 RepID=A0ABM6D3L2_9BACL|nr:hypothetical protein BBH88_07205 [Planococcus antarcticus DSM 14505]